MIDNILKTAPKWMWSNDVNLGAEGQYMIFTENCAYKPGEIAVGYTWPDEPLQADLHRNGAKEIATLKSNFGWPQLNGGMLGEEAVLLHGKYFNKKFFGNEHSVGFYLKHCADFVGRTSYVEGQLILPEEAYLEIVPKLPNAEATLDVLRKAFPKQIIDHCEDKLRSNVRIVADITPKKSIKRSLLGILRRR